MGSSAGVHLQCPPHLSQRCHPERSPLSSHHCDFLGSSPGPTGGPPNSTRAASDHDLNRAGTRRCPGKRAVIGTVRLQP